MDDLTFALPTALSVLFELEPFGMVFSLTPLLAGLVLGLFDCFAEGFVVAASLTARASLRKRLLR